MDAIVQNNSEQQPPDEATTVTAQRRDTIKQVIGTLADDVMREIKALRVQIDDLEQLVISNAARVSDNLNEHVTICGSVRGEVSRLTGIVHELRRNQLGGDLNGQEMR
jgi:hypothetical protein